MAVNREEAAFSVAVGSAPFSRRDSMTVVVFGAFPGGGAHVVEGGVPGSGGLFVDVGRVELPLESLGLELKAGLDTSDWERLTEWLSRVGEDVLGSL